ncbi:MAG TPA: MFS transporter [Nitrolancea sp.]|nr:MFS transporter [Nitrolancea sp.]
MVSRTRSPIRIYLLLVALFSLFFTMFATYSGVYRFSVAHLNPFELVLVGTVLEGSIFLFEIPTGVVADVRSRRISIIIGLFLVGAGFAFEGSFPSLIPILIAQVIWGIGYTFTSGAREAWLADEVNDEARVGRIYLRGAQVGQMASIVGMLFSVALASIHVSVPMVVAGFGVMLLGVLMIFVMSEQNFHPVPHPENLPFAEMGRTFRRGMGVVRGRPVLLTILWIGIFFGMSSEAFDRLWEAHFLANLGFPSLGHLSVVVWFGIINAGAMALSLIVTEIVIRRVDTTSHMRVTRMLLCINVVLALSVIGFGLAGGFTMGLAAYWVAYTMRTANDPLYTAWMNQSLEPRIRATVFSISSQMDALGQIVGGPLIGLIGTAVSIGAAMVTSGLTLVPALVLYVRTGRDRTSIAKVVAESGDGKLSPDSGQSEND